MRLVLIENNTVLKKFILEMTDENTEKLEKDILELNKEILQLKYELNEVKKNCDCEKVKGSGKMKFSEAVKKQKTVIIKPKNSETNINIENEIKSKVNVTELQIGIQEVKTNKTGTVVIKCNNEKSKTSLKKQIEEQLNEEVKIIEPIVNKNNIKIVNKKTKK